MTKSYYKRQGTKYSRWSGMTLKQMCEHYNTYDKNIHIWQKTRPDLSFPEWESYRKVNDYPKQRQQKKVVLA